MKFIENQIVKELFALIIQKYNTENNTEFDPYKISIACSNQVMRSISSRSTYTQFAQRYLYTKGHLVRTRKVDVPISIEERDLAQFLEYLEFKSYEDFLEVANERIYKNLPKLIDLKIPRELILPIQQYLIFFKEFTHTIKGKQIELITKEVKNGIEISYNIPDGFEEIEINNWFEEYINLLKENMNNETIELQNIKAKQGIPRQEVELLKLKMENQIAHLKSSLRIAEFKNTVLEEKYQDIKQLAFSFASQEHVIKNQVITGGNQQFATKIDNKNEN